MSDDTDGMRKAIDALYGRFEDLGVTLTATRRQDYGPDRAVSLHLFQCRECGAAVADEDYPDARAGHARWHDENPSR